MKRFFEKLLLLTRAKPPIGGLEISDSALRFAYPEGARWQLTSIRIPPGVLEAGRIKNRGQFLDLLKSLREHVARETGRRQKLSAVVALSSVNIYTQVFSLPAIKGENLEKAINLNIQMISPKKASEVYSGSKILGESPDQLQIEVLSAFIDRSLSDDMAQAVAEAGFFPLAIESRALALTRLIRKLAVGFDESRPYAFINLDNDDLDFLVLRRGHIYFEYFNSWQDLNAEGKEIRYADFEAAITRNLHRVLNFYNQHWSDQIEEIFLVVLGLKDEVLRILKDNFPLSVREVSVKTDQPIGPEWFIALGAGLRGLVPRREDRDISLTRSGVQEEFRREQLLGFLGFWRAAVPVVLGLIALMMGAVYLYLSQTRSAIEEQARFQLNEGQVREVESLRGKVQQFNRLVALISNIRESSQPKAPFLEKVFRLANQSGIIVNSFSFQDGGGAATLLGQTVSEDNIIKFKQVLSSDPQFKDVSFSLIDVKPAPEGFVFPISFSITSLKTD